MGKGRVPGSVGKDNDFDYSEDQDNLLKLAVVLKASFGKISKAQCTQSGDLAFGFKDSKQFIHARRSRLRGLEISFQRFKERRPNGWVPIPEGYNPHNHFSNLDRKLIRPLTPEEYLQQAFKEAEELDPEPQDPPAAKPIAARRSPQKPPARPKPVRSPQKPPSDMSVSSSSLASLQFEEEGHAYIDGKIEDVANLPDEQYDQLVERAKALGTGKNFSLMGLYALLTGSTTVEKGDATTQALSLTFFDVGVDIYQLYKVAFGGERQSNDAEESDRAPPAVNNRLFIQVPTLKPEERASVLPLLASLQKKTTEQRETEREDAYSKEIRKLHDAGTRASIVFHFFFSKSPLAPPSQ